MMSLITSFAENPFWDSIQNLWQNKLHKYDDILSVKSRISVETVIQVCIHVSYHLAVEQYTKEHNYKNSIADWKSCSKVNCFVVLVLRYSIIT